MARMRPVVVAAFVLTASVLGLDVGCADVPDPARVAGDGGGGSLPSGSSGAPTGSSSSGGGGGGSDNGDPDDPFASGVSYHSTTIADNTTAKHQQVGNADAAPPPSVNANCMSCHGAGGDAQPFAVAGLVFQKPDLPCASCEVLFVDSTAHRVKVTTAADGTFSIVSGAYGEVSDVTRVGIKRGSATRAMRAETVDDGAGTLRGCNSANCHVTNAEGPIVLE